MATEATSESARRVPSVATVLAPGLLDKIVEEGRLGHNEEERRESTGWVEAFLDEILAGQIIVSDDTEAMIGKRISDIDQLLSNQLNEIMHAPKFQKLEGTWRGLNYLVQQTETSPMLQIKVLNASKRDILADARGASEFDQSALFKKIYEEEYGTFGGDPFGLLVGDYEFGRSTEDLEILEKVAGVAAAAHAPFIAASTPQMFGWQSFQELNIPRDLEKGFESNHYVRWRMFREREDSRYVGLVLPHILLREPYGKDSITVNSFNYEEHVDGTDHSKYLWGNASYALAARVTDSFSRYQWCVTIRGVEGGGLVEGLPLHTFETEDGTVGLKCPTEISIPFRREAEFSKLGFVPLCHEKRTDRAVFFGIQTTQKPQKYLDDKANANANLSAQLPYIMAVSRFAHYLKAIAYDKIGSFASRASFERFLNDWINKFVLTDDFASQEQKAQFPLREARIEVSEVPGKPGTYSAVAYLRPHFQLDALTVSMRLVAELPKPKQ